jgi:hypothetical protein
MVRIVINIDRLVLEGFDYHDHLRISRAVQHELSRLVRENGLAQGMYDLPAVDAGAINMRENMGPRMTGIEIARSVYRSLGPNG